MNAYYAHPVSLYGTPQERRDLETIAHLGFEPLSPNTPEFDSRYKKHGMIVFHEAIRNCGALVFRAFPDGSIPAGVAQEIEIAQNYGLPIFELPTGILKRTLDVEKTRETLEQAGQR